MNKSVFSSIFFFTVSLLLLLTEVSTNESAWNASGLTYEGCATGDTVGECIKATVEKEEGVDVIVRRILQQNRQLSYSGLQRQPSTNCKIAGNCIGAVNSQGATCTYYQRCKRAT